MIFIRKATAADTEGISAFQEKMALETENLVLDPDTVKRGVNAVFTDRRKGSYYIAESGGKLAGCLLVTSEWSDWRNGEVLWIQSVYILPEYRKKGIFKLLYNHIKQMVEHDQDLKGIRLYVDKRNESANIVYRKAGMDGDHYQLFEWMNHP
jgi:ribosomal protein S18 acetylase RimI-like enzyme